MERPDKPDKTDTCPTGGEAGRRDNEFAKSLAVKSLSGLSGPVFAGNGGRGVNAGPGPKTAVRCVRFVSFVRFWSCREWRPGSQSSQVASGNLRCSDILIPKTPPVSLGMDWADKIHLHSG